MPDEVYIGIDLGGTLIRAGRFSASLELEARSETQTRSEDGDPEGVIRRMVAQARAIWPGDGAKVAGIGISAPGPINPMTGVVTTPPNLKGWHNVALRDLFQKQVGVPTYLGNDANLAALAEAAMGAAQGYTDIVFLTISTGIGSGVIIAGKLLIGSEGIGDECGHMILVVEGEHVSSLEKEAAGPAIARQARTAIEKGEKSIILDLANGSLEGIDARAVGEAAKAGDALGLRIITRAGRMIGLGIVSLLHIFNPQIVVIGGGVAKGTGDLLFDPLRQSVQQHALDASYWKDLVIAPAKLGENVSLIGAAALARAQGKVS
jgi:glucokinase